MTLELKSARSLPRGERAELFTAAYEGYLMPVHMDEATLLWMEEKFDFDLDASRVACRDDKPVGLANLGVRGTTAWIGGVGVVSTARRGGLGETLMRAVHEEAWARGVEEIWLEVIVENTGAIALYEKLGYERVRDVEVWALPAADADRGVEVEAHEATARIAAQREPWQRADGTLAHYTDVRGLVTDSGAALFRVGAAVSLLRIAGEAEPLLRALQALGDVSVLNLPADDPAADALRSLGGTVTVRQHEMVLRAGS